MLLPALSMFAGSCTMTVSIRENCTGTNRFDQSAELTELKAAFPVYKNVYSQVLQQVLDRLDKSFKNFFRSGFGFPRFKGQHRFDSFTYPQSGFSFDGNQLSLSKIGNVKVRLSRELSADAVVKTCTLSAPFQDGLQPWYSSIRPCHCQQVIWQWGSMWA